MPKQNSTTTRQNITSTRKPAVGDINLMEWNPKEAELLLDRRLEALERDAENTKAVLKSLNDFIKLITGADGVEVTVTQTMKKQADAAESLLKPGKSQLAQDAAAVAIQRELTDNDELREKLMDDDREYAAEILARVGVGAYLAALEGRR